MLKRFGFSRPKSRGRKKAKLALREKTSRGKAARMRKPVEHGHGVRGARIGHGGILSADVIDAPEQAVAADNWHLPPIAHAAPRTACRCVRGASHTHIHTHIHTRT